MNTSGYSMFSTDPSDEIFRNLVTREISNVGRMCSLDKLKVRIVEEKLNTF